MAGVPHEVVGDELPASLERVQQGERSDGSDQLGLGVDLDHGQSPSGGRDRITFVGVRLLPDPECVDLRLEAVPVDDRREVRVLHGCVLSLLLLGHGRDVGAGPAFSTWPVPQGGPLMRWFG
jgi:hypothetical protein